MLWENGGLRIDIWMVISFVYISYLFSVQITKFSAKIKKCPPVILLFLDQGSEIRDPQWKKNRIRDKQHWFWGSLVTKNIRETDTSFFTSPLTRDYNFINCLISICNKVVSWKKNLDFSERQWTAAAHSRHRQHSWGFQTDPLSGMSQVKVFNFYSHIKEQYSGGNTCTICKVNPPIRLLFRKTFYMQICHSAINILTWAIFFNTYGHCILLYIITPFLSAQYSSVGR